MHNLGISDWVILGHNFGISDLVIFGVVGVVTWGVPIALAIVFIRKKRNKD